MAGRRRSSLFRFLVLFKLLPFHQPGKRAVQLHQLFVGAFFDNPALFQVQDPVALADGGQPVGDDNPRAAD